MTTELTFVPIPTTAAPRTSHPTPAGHRHRTIDVAPVTSQPHEPCMGVSTARHPLEHALTVPGQGRTTELGEPNGVSQVVGEECTQHAHVEGLPHPPNER